MADAGSLQETRRDHLDAAALADAIATHNAIMVRGLVSATDARALDDSFKTAIAAAQNQQASDWYAPVDDGTVELQGARAWVQSSDCALLADSPPMLDHVLSIYRRSGLIDLISAYLGETPVLSAQKSTLRRALGAKVYTDNWHQDGAFLGAGTKVINVWLALTDCGERAPSVEIGLSRQTGIVPTGGEGAETDWSVGPQQALKASPRSAVPVCAPGDALVFDHLCLHRTSMNPAYSEERRALETWFFAPSAYPSAFDPHPIRV